MPDHEARPALSRQIVLVAHTLAMRSYLLRHPHASRASAWGFARQHWQDFLVRAAVFEASRELRRMIRTARP